LILTRNHFCFASLLFSLPPHVSTQAGFRAGIVSQDPRESLLVVQEDQSRDLEAMVRAVRRYVQIFEVLQQAGLCKERVLPPPEIDLNNTASVVSWLKDTHGTVYHWCTTCKAGVNGAVADEKFRVRANTPSSVVENLYVGSAAALPDIPEANPHLTITALSVALAHLLLQAEAARLNLPRPGDTDELRIAARDLASSGGVPVIRRPGSESPQLSAVAAKYYREWQCQHPSFE
jgi:hypothetical protein